jgi:hypothetical protein
MENETFNQHKFEATKLEIQAKHGSITPEGQERLNQLQAKMDAFWEQRLARTQNSPNLLQRLIDLRSQPGNSDEQATPVEQPLHAQLSPTPGETQPPPAMSREAEALEGESNEQTEELPSESEKSKRWAAEGAAPPEPPNVPKIQRQESIQRSRGKGQSPSDTTDNPVMRVMQGSIQRKVEQGFIQPKCEACAAEEEKEKEEQPIPRSLALGQPGDKYEHEADAVARQLVEKINASESHQSVQRQFESERGSGIDITVMHPSEGAQVQQKVNHNFIEQTDLAQKIASVESQLVQRQRGKPACYGTNRRAGIEHETIQQDYIATKDPTGVREYSIPGGSASDGVGYADLVGLGTHAIYEIKPYTPNNITAGLVQVNRYLQAAQSNCDPKAPWHLGFAYPDTVLPLGSDRELVAKQYNNPGLILYYTRNRRRRVPQPEPVPLPVPAPGRERSTDSQRERSPQPAPTPAINWENVFQVVIGLGLSIATVAVVLYALLSPEPASKLAAAGLSVAMITIILSHFGIEDSNNQA